MKMGSDLTAVTGSLTLHLSAVSIEGWGENKIPKYDPPAHTPPHDNTPLQNMETHCFIETHKYKTKMLHETVPSRRGTI